MKINQLPPNGYLNKTSAKSTTPSTGLDFKQLLDSRLPAAAETATASVGASSTLGASSAVSPSLRVEGLALTETTINTLEAFGNALGNVNIPTEALTPYLGALEENKNAISSLQAQLPSNDPLAKLLEQVAAVTSLEMEKFRRGDYHA